MATLAILLFFGLCVFGVLGGAAAAFLSAVGGPEPVATETPLADVDPEAAEVDRLQQWIAWNPPLGSIDTTAPDPRQQDIAERVAARLFPDLAVYEVLITPGYYDEAEDFHIADTYYFRAMSEAGDIDIAFYFYGTAASWADAGISWDPDTVADTRTLESLDDGVQFEYDTYAFPESVDGSAAADYWELLRTAHLDWPDGIVVWAQISDDSVSGTTYQTTWDSYQDDRAFIGIESHYSLEIDGSWHLREWDWYQE